MKKYKQGWNITSDSICDLYTRASLMVIWHRVKHKVSVMVHKQRKESSDWNNTHHVIWNSNFNIRRSPRD